MESECPLYHVVMILIDETAVKKNTLSLDKVHKIKRKIQSSVPTLLGMPMSMATGTNKRCFSEHSIYKSLIMCKKLGGFADNGIKL